MFQGIQVIKYYGDCTRAVYGFTLLESPQELDLLCTYYCSQIRETKRHGWKTMAVASVYDKRNSNLDFKDFELPLDVVEEARTRLEKKISVRKWDRS